MKDSMTQEDLRRYRNLITSFVNNAIVQTEGVVTELGIVKRQLGISTMNTKNIHIYFLNNEVSIDIFINVIYGYNVPKVTCAIQEKIIAAIKESTHFEVKSINVNVSNVIFV